MMIIIYDHHIFIVQATGQGHTLDCVTAECSTQDSSNLTKMLDCTLITFQQKQSNLLLKIVNVTKVL